MNEKTNYKCLKCDKELAHRQSLFKHTKNCGKLQVETFSCSQCDKVFTRKDTLLRHVRKFCKSNSSKTRNTFICSVRSKMLDRNKHLERHAKSVAELFDHVYIDLHFSEDLSVPVKFEPQSMHWHYEQVTVHSGILKQRGEKS